MSCRALNCKNSKFKNNKTKSFFIFPKTEPLLSLWLDVCVKNKQYNAGTWFICSDHFRQEDIMGAEQKENGFCKRVYIKPGSIPFLKAEAVTRTQKRLNTSKNGFKTAKTPINIAEASEDHLDTLNESFSDDHIMPLKTRTRERLVTRERDFRTADIAEVSEDHLETINPSLSDDPLMPLKKDLLLDKIKMLQKELELLDEKSKKQEVQFWQNKVKTLEEKLVTVNAEKMAMEKQLKQIFTDGQIQQIKTPMKKTHWEESDLTSSLTLYSTSAKFYRLLLRKKFPLPSICTLQRWSQKVNKTILTLLTNLLKHKFLLQKSIFR